eukprot:COSAG01_NODE_8624_length_2716_cov_2.982423_4_plen_49_part_01
MDLVKSFVLACRQASARDGPENYFFIARGGGWPAVVGGLLLLFTGILYP